MSINKGLYRQFNDAAFVAAVKTYEQGWVKQ